MNLISRVVRKLCWTFFQYLPKNKNKIVFESFNGRGYSDSPKAIAEEFRKRGGYLLYWVVNDMDEELPFDVKPLKRDSARSVWHYATAGVWVDNSRKMSYVKKRKSQTYVQTWHGFPLKCIENDAKDVLEPYYVEAAYWDSQFCDLMLSNGRFMTELYGKSFWYYGGTVMEGGFPRNDILVKPGKGIAGQVRKSLGLPEDCRFILYAPTFRRERGLEVYDVDYEGCIRALSGRFGGEWMVLARLHPSMAARAEELRLDPRFVRNVSMYPDIQELYLLADAMLTDYSSVMFDYMVTGKPCFLYVNDLSAYKDDRDFYYDIDKLPYQRAENNEELSQIIGDYDPVVQRAGIDSFYNEFGIEETGCAAERAADFIEGIVG